MVIFVYIDRLFGSFDNPKIERPKSSLQNTEMAKSAKSTWFSRASKSALWNHMKL